MDLATYLSFDGQCEQAFRFYAEVLGGQILMLARYSEAPAGEPVHEGMANRIMHARLKVGDRLLMGGDAPPGRVHRPQGFCVLIAADSAGEAERMFNALADGGTITMPFGETFWAHRFGMAIDRFGTPWMVNFEKAMAAQVAGSKPFVISRTFAAPRHEVWKAFTDPDRLRQWWGPKGATVTASKMDLRPGGSVDLVALTERLRLAGDRSSARLNPFGPVSLYGYPLALGVLLLSLDGWLAWRGGRP